MRKSKKAVFAAFAASFALAASFIGCGGSGSNSVSADNNKTEEKKSMVEGGELVFGTATELNNFNPFDSLTADVRAVNFNIFEGLVKVSTDGSFVPALAESYSVTDDAKEYCFALRENVKFHNGKALTYDDVLYSIQKAIDSGFAGYNEIESFGLVGGDAPDALCIRLKKPNAGFLPYLSTAIVPCDYDEQTLKPVGTGPFKFVEYAEQDHIKLVKNEEYWGEKAHLDSVVMKFVSSQANLVISFESGSIDGFKAEAGTVMQIDENKLTKYQSNSNSVQLIALNNDFEPFKDVRVRQALNYLVDCDEIINTVNYGYGVKVGSGLIPALAKYFDDSCTSVYSTNVEKAKELLAQAGYGNGFKFTITVPSSYTVHVDTASVVVNQFAKAGINVEIKQVDWATWLQNVYKGRQYEATIISLDGSLAYPTAFLSRYVSTAHNNFMNYKSAEYDDYYSKAVSTVDENEKVANFKKAQQILNKDAASVFLQDISEFSVYNKNFAGYAGYPLYAIDFSAVYQLK